MVNESAVTAPRLVMVNGDPVPTENSADGVAVLIPTKPELRICRRSLDAVFSITSPDALASESPVTMASVVADKAAAEPSPEEDMVDPSAKMIWPPEPDLMRMSPPTSSFDEGVVVLMPTFPLLRILMGSVAPLFPVWKMMSAPDVPAPVVERKVRVEVVVVPPWIRGAVMLVANVGAVLNTAVPVPVSSERDVERLFEDMEDEAVP